jgi:hypothetical protein
VNPGKDILRFAKVDASRGAFVIGLKRYRIDVEPVHELNVVVPLICVRDFHERRHGAGGGTHRAKDRVLRNDSIACCLDVSFQNAQLAAPSPRPL